MVCKESSISSQPGGRRAQFFIEPDRLSGPQNPYVRHFLRMGRSMLIVLVATFVTVAAAAAKDKPTGDWLPKIHFSASPLWNNDPNGPILVNGEYQLYYQNNPSGDEWGNMSWGHAMSTDLLHWTKLPVALPPRYGVMNFSGSVVEDSKNTSGLCGDASKSKSSCLVAIYTGYTKSVQGEDRQDQNIAVSQDGGMTWTPYAHNPVLDLMMSNFRDPKVFWYEPGQTWVMLVMLSDLHTVQFYRSKDLKHWKFASSFGPAGATGGAWECPDLMNLDVRDANGKVVGKHWILSVNLNPGGVAGGSGNQYFLGQFDGKRFIPDSRKSPKRWVDWGKDFYASTSFANIPAAEDRLWIGWMNNWLYAAATPSLPGRGEMTLARHLYLRQEGVGEGATDLLELVQEPVLPKASQTPVSNLLTIKEANARFGGHGPASGVYMIRATLEPGSASEIGVRLRRSSLNPDEAASEETVVGVDIAKSQIFVDRRRSGYTSFSPDFPVRTAAPMKHPQAKEIVIEIVVDRSSVEVFAENGETVLTNLIFPSDASQGLSFYATGAATEGAAPHLKDLEVIHLE